MKCPLNRYLNESTGTLQLATRRKDMYVVSDISSDSYSVEPVYCKMYCGKDNSLDLLAGRRPT